MTTRYLLSTVQAECATFAVAHALSESGAEVDIVLFPGATKHEGGRWYVEERIKKLPRVAFVEAPRGRYSLVVHEAGAWRPDPGLFRKVVAASDRLTLVLAGFEGGWMKRWKNAAGFLWRHREAMRKRPIFSWMALLPRQSDLTAWVGRRTVLPVDVHANFLCNPEWYAAIFEVPWDPSATRPHVLNYVGSEKPAARKDTLDAVLGVLAVQGVSVTRSLHPQEGEVAWVVDGSADPLDYCRILDGADFTLCPIGFVGWTHRVVEALCRGSIPILPAWTTPFYHVPLVHGETAWLVDGRGWAHAIQAALATTQEERARMRRNIADMRAGSLSAAAFSAAIRRSVGG